MTPKALNAVEAAKYIGASYDCFRRLVKQGLLTPLPMTKSYPVEDLDRYIEILKEMRERARIGEAHAKGRPPRSKAKRARPGNGQDYSEILLQP